MSLDDDCRELMRLEMKAAELMQDIISDHDNGEINDSMTNVVNSLMGNLDDPNRKRIVLAICLKMGESIGSHEMVALAKGKLEELLGESGV